MVSHSLSLSHSHTHAHTHKISHRKAHTQPPSPPPPCILKELRNNLAHLGSWETEGPEKGKALHQPTKPVHGTSGQGVEMGMMSDMLCTPTV